MERRNAMRDAMLPGRDPETANAFRRQLDALLARREPDAFMPPRNPEMAAAFRQSVDDLFAPRDPTRDYGAILPISSDPNVPGSGQFDPKGGFIGELLGLLGAGGRAMRGEAYDPMAITSGLMNVAAPSVAARPSPNTARIFGGESAKGVQNAFWRARDQTSRNYNPEIVHHNTGVFRAPEGRLMFEIDDAAARINPANLNRTAYGYEIPFLPKTPLTVGRVLDHPELYRHYPQIADTPLKSTGFNFDVSGAYDPVKSQIFLSGGKPEAMRATLLHEIQHNIQNIENFAQGGNISQFLPANHSQLRRENSDAMLAFQNSFLADGIDFNPYTLMNALKAEVTGKTLPVRFRVALEEVKNDPRWPELKTVLLNKAQLDATETAAFPKYTALPGERMARTVEERRDMTAAERRAGGIPRIVD